MGIMVNDKGHKTNEFNLDIHHQRTDIVSLCKIRVIDENRKTWKAKNLTSEDRFLYKIFFCDFSSFHLHLYNA